MLHINLNSKIVNPAPAAPLAHRLLWRLGFDMACEGRSFFDCKTTDERAGFRAAINACADCETDGYLAVKRFSPPSESVGQRDSAARNRLVRS